MVSSSSPPIVSSQASTQICTVSSMCASYMYMLHVRTEDQQQYEAYIAEEAYIDDCDGVMRLATLCLQYGTGKGR